MPPRVWLTIFCGSTFRGSMANKLVFVSRWFGYSVCCSVGSVAGTTISLRANVAPCVRAQRWTTQRVISQTLSFSTDVRSLAVQLYGEAGASTAFHFIASFALRLAVRGSKGNTAENEFKSGPLASSSTVPIFDIFLRFFVLRTTPAV